jgi:hypothetical protein
LQRRQQLADLVVRIDVDGLGQVAVGHALRQAQGLADRIADAADQEEGNGGAQRGADDVQCDRHHACVLVTRQRRFVFALGDVDLQLDQVLHVLVGRDEQLHQRAACRGLGGVGILRAQRRDRRLESQLDELGAAFAEGLGQHFFVVRQVGVHVPGPLLGNLLDAAFDLIDCGLAVAALERCAQQRALVLLHHRLHAAQVGQRDQAVVVDGLQRGIGGAQVPQASDADDDGNRAQQRGKEDEAGFDRDVLEHGKNWLSGRRPCVEQGADTSL